jgi:hypothetical protein
VLEAAVLLDAAISDRLVRVVAVVIAELVAS